jgi:5-methylcytosine-specific restriction endonuclease McrA
MAQDPAKKKATFRAWYATHREYYVLRRAKKRDELRAYKRAWYAANLEKERARVRARAAKRRAANPQAVREYNNTWNAAHPEKARRRAIAWNAAHPDRRAVAIRNCSIRRRGAKGSHTPEDIQAQRKRQRNKCFWCSCSLSSGYHVDHVIPLSKGGTNHATNLVLACPSCNCRKHAKMPSEFAGRLL